MPTVRRAPTGGQVLDNPRGRKPRRAQLAVASGKLYGDWSTCLASWTAMRMSGKRAMTISSRAAVPAMDVVKLLGQEEREDARRRVRRCPHRLLNERRQGWRSLVFMARGSEVALESSRRERTSAR